MNCLICGSVNLQTMNTIISDFVMARIDPTFAKHKHNRVVKLCYCRDCTFAFYDYRFSEDEEHLLYRNYRDEEYQKTRETYECWYTKKVNDAINNEGVGRQQEVIRNMLAQVPHEPIRVALDYGGNRGATFFDELGTEEKYVYDISGVDTISGVVGISEDAELRKHRYDFIMCNMVLEHLTDPNKIMKRLFQLGNSKTIYYIEVPSENPFTKANKFSVLKNLALLSNKNYSWFRLAKYYFQQRRQPFMPMKEHINFFTPKSISAMSENNGFSVVNIQENKYGNSDVLSILFTKVSNDCGEDI